MAILFVHQRFNKVKPHCHLFWDKILLGARVGFSKDASSVGLQVLPVQENQLHLMLCLASLVCKASPQELKFIIIDPKRLEFAAFHDIAHLLFPVITDPRRAALLLNGWLKKWKIDMNTWHKKEHVILLITKHIAYKQDKKIDYLYCINY